MWSNLCFPCTARPTWAKSSDKVDSNSLPGSGLLFTFGCGFTVPSQPGNSGCPSVAGKAAFHQAHPASVTREDSYDFLLPSSQALTQSLGSLPTHQGLQAVPTSAHPSIPQTLSVCSLLPLSPLQPDPHAGTKCPNHLSRHHFKPLNFQRLP